MEAPPESAAPSRLDSSCRTYQLLRVTPESSSLFIFWNLSCAGFPAGWMLHRWNYSQLPHPGRGVPVGRDDRAQTRLLRAEFAPAGIRYLFGAELLDTDDIWVWRPDREAWVAIYADPRGD